ncbi:MAG TPA: methionyl-tRNA formyltransferase [Thermoanaerobaculia bacterium]|jgi:methionyl-tRNA formyltransferase
MLKTVFFGTPEFAVPSLEAAMRVSDVALVVTQPDRPAGRHAAPRPSAIARRAAEAGLAVEKPERVKANAELLERLRRIGPDVGVVVAYGRILPAAMLAIPRLGFVNVHASLLPRHRGAAPVQAALLAGDAETGVVTMRVVEELDAGPLYLARRVAIRDAEDAGALSHRLAREGADLLAETLAGLEGGALEPVPQRGEPTFSRPLRREDGEADWNAPAAEIARRLLAFTPWPGLFTFLGGERVKLLAADVAEAPASLAPGELARAGDRAVVGAGGGSGLVLRRVQREGRNPVSAAEFLRGLPELPVRLGR